MNVQEPIACPKCGGACFIPEINGPAPNIKALIEHPNKPCLYGKDFVLCRHLPKGTDVTGHDAVWTKNRELVGIKFTMPGNWLGDA